MAKRFEFSEHVYLEFNNKTDENYILDMFITERKSVYIINHDEAVSPNLLAENLKGFNLEDGYLFFDLPNFSDDNLNYNEILNTVLKNVKTSKNTKVFALHNPYNHFEKHEFIGLEELNSLIAEKFPKGKNAKANQLLFPNVITYNAENPSISLNYVYDLPSVKRASDVINYVLNKLRNGNLSPYEQFLAAYAFVASLEYNEFGNVASLDKSGNAINLYGSVNQSRHGNEIDPLLSRTIVNTLNTGLIVCASYADMLVLICNRLGINAVTESLDIFTKDEQGNDFIEGHRRAIINLKDEKYGINGIYVSDPTNDSKNNYFDLDFKQFVHHAIPIREPVFNENSDYVSLALGKIPTIKDGGKKEFERHLIESGLIEGFDKIPSEFELLKNLVENNQTIKEKHIENLNKTKNAEHVEGYSEKSSKELRNNMLNFYIQKANFAKQKEHARLNFMVSSSKTKRISPKDFVRALTVVAPIINKSQNPENYARSLYVQNAKITIPEVVNPIKTFNPKTDKEFYDECAKNAMSFDFSDKRMNEL